MLCFAERVFHNVSLTPRAMSLRTIALPDPFPRSLDCLCSPSACSSPGVSYCVNCFKIQRTVSRSSDTRAPCALHSSPPLFSEAHLQLLNRSSRECVFEWKSCKASGSPRKSCGASNRQGLRMSHSTQSASSFCARPPSTPFPSTPPPPPPPITPPPPTHARGTTANVVDSFWMLFSSKRTAVLSVLQLLRRVGGNRGRLPSHASSSLSTRI